MVTTSMSERSGRLGASWVALSTLLTGCAYDVVVGGNAPGNLTTADAAVDDAPSNPTVHCPQENLPSPEGDTIDEIGASLNGPSCARTRRGEVICWGLVPPEIAPAAPARVAGLSCVRALASGRSGAAVLDDGSVRTFRVNLSLNAPLPVLDGGMLGLPDVSYNTLVERPLGLPSVVGIDVGRSRYCAWGNDGAVHCWGAPFFGERGEASAPPSDGRRPIAAPTLLPSLTDVVQLSTSTDVGPGHGCALHRDHSVSCLGSNGSHQLGDGTTTARTTPQRVLQLTGVTQVSVAQGISCAVRNDGRVMCWGRVVGDVPSGLAGPADFVEIRGIVDATQVSVGGLHACARTARGRVLCWGDNQYGALGNGTLVSQNYPVEVLDLTDVTQVVTSAFHTCALRADHTVWCWGGGAGARVGPLNTEPVLRPRQIVF
jgi:hypothetical protein